MNIQKATQLAKAKKTVEFGEDSVGRMQYVNIRYWEGGRNKRAYIAVYRPEHLTNRDAQGWIDLSTGEVNVTGGQRTMEIALEKLGL